MTRLVIDGSYTLHRNKYVMKTRYGAYQWSGKLLAAMFFRSVVKMTRESQASQIMVAWDTDSHKMHSFDYYKGNRFRYAKLTMMEKAEYDKTEDALADQCYYEAVQLLNEALPYVTVSSAKLSRYEADDIGGYLANHFKNVMLASDDRDWFISMNPTTKILRPIGNEVIDYQYMLEEYGDDPVTYFKFEKALMGDGGDNIERITTPAPAKKIASYLVYDDKAGERPWETKVLNVEGAYEHLQENLFLVDTCLLQYHPEARLDLHTQLANVHDFDSHGILKVLEILGSENLPNYQWIWRNASTNLDPKPTWN